MIYDKSNALKWLAVCGFLSANLMWAETSAAQECADLGSDPEWMTLSQKMNEQIIKEDYKAAKKIGNQMLKKCPFVPSTNYLMGRIYQKLGDYKSAHTHFSIATDNTEQFATDKSLLKDMWYARYESEYPDAYALRNSDVVTIKTSDLQSMKNTDKAKLLTDMNMAKAFMWTGVGIGIAGALTAIGGGVWAGIIKYFGSDDYTINLDAFGSKNNNLYIDVNKNNLVTNLVSAYVLMGVGITAAVTGVIIAAFNGHLYTQLKTTAELENKVETSVNLSYNQITFNMTF